MDREEVYEFVEEADKREVKELLDAVVNRFRELYEDYELVVISLPVGENRKEELERIIDMLRREPDRKKLTAGESLDDTSFCFSLHLQTIRVIARSEAT